MRNRFLVSFVLFSAVLAAGHLKSQPAGENFNIAFFEGGSYPAHAELRRHFRDQLKALLPEGLRVVYVPSGFKSADWNRDESRAMATELAGDNSIDLVVAVGPWTVEDLLAAGFDRPIVAMCRLDPSLEGLIDSLGRPVVDNLTVRLRSNKLESDLLALSRLVDVKRLGLLHFPLDVEQDPVLERGRAIGQKLGFEIVTAEGYDREGTYAFFLAYGKLDKKIDALYLPPLWGFDPVKVRQFYDMVLRDRIPVFSSEGEYHVTRGAFAAGSGEFPRVAARYHAWKTVQIMQGEIPAELPVVFPELPGVTVNSFVARQLGIVLANDLWLRANVIESPPSDDVERLTLKEATALAMAQNPGYLRRYDVLEAAVQAAGQAWSAFLPQLRVSGLAMHHDDNTVNNDDRFSNDRYRATVNLDQAVLSLGAVRDIQLAARNRDLKRTSLQQATLDLELALATACINFLEAEQVRKVLFVHRRQVEQCTQVARVKERMNDGDPADVLRWEDERLKSIRIAVDAQGNLEVARILLNTLLGRPGDMRFVLDGRAFTDKKILAELSLLRQLTVNDTERRHLEEFLSSEAMKANPLTQRDGIALSMRRAELSRNTARFYPEIGFRASLSLVNERPTTAAFEEKNRIWSVGTLFELPLFLGGDRFKERKKLEAELNGMEYQKDNTRLEISARVQVQLQKLLDLATEFPMAVRSAELATEYAEMMMNQYNTGGRSIVELLDAVQNDRRTSLEAIAIQFEYFETVARLVHEIGWSAHQNNRTPEEELLSRLASFQDSGR